MIEKTNLVVPDNGEGRKVHYAFFGRSGFTDAAVAEAQYYHTILVDLESLGRTLGAS